MWGLRERTADVMDLPVRTSRLAVQASSPAREAGLPESALYRAAAGGLLVGAVLTLLSSLLSPEATGTPPQGTLATPFYYPTAIVGVTLVVLCVPALFLRLREGKGAVLAMCGTLLMVAAGIGLAFGLGFAAALGLTSRVGFITLLALPWSVMLALPPFAVDGGPALPNVFFILSIGVVGLGGVLLGVAMLRAKTLGRATGVALISCAVLSVVLGCLPLPAALSGGGGEAAYATGLVCGGVALWRASGPARSDEDPQRVACADNAG